jgi:hypothetical protein
VRLFRAFGGGWNFENNFQDNKEKPSATSDT